jgi:hypothetical protein
MLGLDFLEVVGQSPWMREEWHSTMDTNALRHRCTAGRCKTEISSFQKLLEWDNYASGLLRPEGGEEEAGCLG